MADKRAPLASHELADLHVALTPIRERRSAVEAAGAQGWPLPAPSETPRRLISQPLPVERPKKDRLVLCSFRLPISQVEMLEALKAERGLVTSELVRDFIAKGLQDLGI